MAFDVSRAYSYAPSIRPVYVKIVDEHYEDGNENRCGRLNVSMHGARDAALNWHDHCTNNLEKLGLLHGEDTPRAFHHPTRNVRLFVHGGDYVTNGRDSQLQWFAKEMEKAYECQVHTQGAGKNDENHVKALDRLTGMHQNDVVRGTSEARRNNSE